MGFPEYVGEQLGRCDREKQIGDGHVAQPLIKKFLGCSAWNILISASHFLLLGIVCLDKTDKSAKDLKVNLLRSQVLIKCDMARGLPVRKNHPILLDSC